MNITKETLKMPIVEGKNVKIITTLSHELYTFTFKKDEYDAIVADFKNIGCDVDRMVTLLEDVYKMGTRAAYAFVYTLRVIVSPFRLPGSAKTDS